MGAENDDELPVDITTTDGEPPYFAYSASLRIFGRIEDLKDISERLRVNPTTFHRHGERHGERSPAYEHDMWAYQAPVSEDRPLSEHLQTLWGVVKGNQDCLLQLKETLRVDIFCGYRTNCWGAGFAVAPEALEIFTALNVPFGVSVIVA